MTIDQADSVITLLVFISWALTALWLSLVKSSDDDPITVLVGLSMIVFMVILKVWLIVRVIRYGL